MLAVEAEVEQLRESALEFRAAAEAFRRCSARLGQVSAVTRLKDDTAIDRVIRDMRETSAAHAAVWTDYARRCERIADDWEQQMTGAEQGADVTTVTWGRPSPPVVPLELPPVKTPEVAAREAG